MCCHVLASSVARWNDITRCLTLWVEILELNDQGQYMPVPVREQADVRTGGVYQLKQVRGEGQEERAGRGGRGMGAEDEVREQGGDGREGEERGSREKEERGRRGREGREVW